MDQRTRALERSYQIRNDQQSLLHLLRAYRAQGNRAEILKHLVKVVWEGVYGQKAHNSPLAELSRSVAQIVGAAPLDHRKWNRRIVVGQCELSVVAGEGLHCQPKKFLPAGMSSYESFEVMLFDWDNNQRIEEELTPAQLDNLILSLALESIDRGQVTLAYCAGRIPDLTPTSEFLGANHEATT